MWLFGLLAMLGRIQTEIQQVTQQAMPQNTNITTRTCVHNNTNQRDTNYKRNNQHPPPKPQHDYYSTGPLQHNTWTQHNLRQVARHRITNTPEGNNRTNTSSDNQHNTAEQHSINTTTHQNEKNTTENNQHNRTKATQQSRNNTTESKQHNRDCSR